MWLFLMGAEYILFILCLEVVAESDSCWGNVDKKKVGPIESCVFGWSDYFQLDEMC